MSSWWKAGLAGVAIIGGVVAATAFAVAQMAPGPHGMHERMMGGQQGMHGQMMDGRQGMHGRMMPGGQGMHGGMGGMDGMMGQRAGMSGRPAMPGQDAFGAIQEVVQILESDSATDWSKIDIAALREHLIDMNEVTLRAAADQRVLDNGLEINVTGEGRTLTAIKRMVPAHIAELARSGWNAKTEDLPNGVKLVVTSANPAELVKLKALGFMGIMVQGGHHQPHHLAMAKGTIHAH